LEAKSKRKQYELLLQMKQLSDSVHSNQAINAKAHQQQLQQSQFAFMDREDTGLDPWTTFMFDQYIRPAEKQMHRTASAVEQAAKQLPRLAKSNAYTIEEGDERKLNKKT